MEIVETILTRRSIRAYDQKPIPEELLYKVLDVTRHAPSGSNREPTRLIVVKDLERRTTLSALCSHQSFIAQAPVVIVAVGKVFSSNRGGYMGNFSNLLDGAIVLDHLTLIARSEGLGTCWIGSFDNDRIKRFLQIPEGWQIIGLTPLGYPNTERSFKPTDKRMPLEQFVMEERWIGEEK
ncbi:nitroreductase family protein [Pleomorphochaeta sp. DL1XJH-081]|uniref:nitroreductase family protein n=1 Tax=Pleomorphochaeta sp. DL1XJH-081 TaxID=3409690 RepID=UPI003BB7DF34